MYNTIEEYETETGHRFKSGQDQELRGLTREASFEEFKLNGFKMKKPRDRVENSVWFDTNLTIDNFQEKTGMRFRLRKGEKQNNVTREDAFKSRVVEMKGKNAK